MADSKVADLTALTTITTDDLFYVVNDPGGTPGDRKAAAGDIATSMAGMAGFTAAYAPVVGSVGGAPRVVRKSADETVTSSTTLQDDDHLVFAIGASQTWVVNYYVFYEAVSAADIKFSLAVPASGAFHLGGIGANASVTDPSAAGSIRLSSAAGVTLVYGSESGFTPTLLLTASVVNSTNAGNVVLQWAQNASSGTGSVVKAGSYLVAHRIA